MQMLRTLKLPAIRRFMLDESGATAIEYAMIAAGIAGVIITVVYALGGGVVDMFDRISAAYTG